MIVGQCAAARVDDERHGLGDHQREIPGGTARSLANRRGVSTPDSRLASTDPKANRHRPGRRIVSDTTARQGKRNSSCRSSVSARRNSNHRIPVIRNQIRDRAKRARRHGRHAGAQLDTHSRRTLHRHGGFRRPLNRFCTCPSIRWS